MKRLAEFPLDQGGTVLVEVDDAPGGGPVTRGLGRDRPGLVERTDRTFEEATATVTPAVGDQHRVRRPAERANRGVHRVRGGRGELPGLSLTWRAEPGS